MVAVPLGGTVSDRGPAGSSSLVREAIDGVRATSGMPRIRIMLAVSSVGLFFGGAFNVAEFLFVTENLAKARSAEV